MAEYAVMPYADYEDACEAVREKTGGTAVIKSGEMGAQIRAIDTVETCTVTVTGSNVGSTLGVAYTAYENGEFVAKAPITTGNTFENIVCGSAMSFYGAFISGTCSDGEIVVISVKGCIYQAPRTAGATASLTLVKD